MMAEFSLVALVVASVAAGCGAVCRLLLDGAATLLLKRASSWGTAIVNLSGSLAIGVVAGIVVSTAAGVEANLAGALAADSLPVSAALGFLGGYTTFSTASYQTVRLAQSGRMVAAVANGFLQLAAAVLMVALGWGAVSALIGA